MPSVDQVIKDPEFYQLPAVERQKVLQKIDPDFAGLPDGEQKKAVAGLTRKFSGQIDTVSSRQKQPESSGIVQTAENVVGSLGKAAANAPRSGLNLLNNIGKAVLHPIDTAQSLGEVAMGGVSKLLPGLPNEERNEAAFDSVVGHFKNRYGTNEGLVKAIEEDPAGVMADISAALMGGGGAVRLAGTTAKVAPVAKVGESVARAGAAMDPIAATGTLVGKPLATVAKKAGDVGAEVLGVTTGAGPEAIRQAVKGEKGFTDGLRGKVTGEEILSDTKTALGNIREERGAKYRQQLGEIAKDQRQLNIAPIKQKVGELLSQFNIKKRPAPVKHGMHGVSNYDFSRSTLNRNAQADVEAILETVDGWGSQPGDLTPIGLDTLKRQLDDFYSDSKNSKALVTSLRNTVKGEIVKAVPEYAKMTKDYEQITRLTKEMEKALSLSDRAMMDTAIKKLTSTMRENFEFRRQLLGQIEEMTGAQLAPQIAGTTMNQTLPKGLVGKMVGGGGIVAGQLSPYFLSMAAISSPRIMGEFLNGLGFTARQASQLVGVAKSSRAFSTGKRVTAAQSGGVANRDREAQNGP